MSDREIRFVKCPECNYEQTDMGRGVACEECGYGPMPTESDDEELERPHFNPDVDHQVFHNPK